MKSLSIRGFVAMSLVAAFMFFGCSDDSSPVVTDDETGALSSSDDSVVESSSSSKKVSSSSAEEKSSSSSKKTKKSSSSFVEDDETDSSSSFEKSSSSELVIVVPDQSDFTITASELDSRVAGDEVRFKGKFMLNLLGDSTVVDSSLNIYFTSISYMVGVGTDINSMARANVNVNSNIVILPTQNTIDLNAMSSAHVSIDLLDPGFTECGMYSLIVTVTATSGDMVFQRTEIIPFERDAAEYCRTEDTTSQQPVKAEIPMTSCQVELSTNVNPGVDLAYCVAVPAVGAATADIFFEKAGDRNNPELSAKSGSGLLFSPITNGDLPPYTDDYEVDIWPEDINADRVPATAYVSDFKFNAIDGVQLNNMIQNFNQIYVAKAPTYNAETGEGFYAFAITDATEGIDGDYTFKVKIYKVP
ncbi:MAG: hypothetical protein J6P15_04740 [Fibrobacter sp.]|nr:hypothetical protein [Fibrobacter sp.]